MDDQLTVKVLWDKDAKVFVATSEDVPGLVAEAESLDALLADLKILIPEMLEENDSPIGWAFDGYLPFRLDVPVLAEFARRTKRAAG
ncbi:MAG TPA: DUF1902 domain-containing protein [Alphaproteobacteria bacterium]|jgi:predicted RNase H-like HicB family nuclease